MTKSPGTNEATCMHLMERMNKKRKKEETCIVHVLNSMCLSGYVHNSGLYSKHGKLTYASIRTPTGQMSLVMKSYPACSEDEDVLRNASPSFFSARK